MIGAVAEFERSLNDEQIKELLARASAGEKVVALAR